MQNPKIFAIDDNRHPSNILDSLYDGIMSVGIIDFLLEKDA